MGNKNIRDGIMKRNSDDINEKEKQILQSIIGTFEDKNALQIRAALKIQRQARRRSAWKVAQSDNQWKVLNNKVKNNGIFNAILILF